MLLELRERGVRQGSLFDTSSVFDSRRDRLMSVLDQAEQKWGRGTIAPGSAGFAVPRTWVMKRGSMTPAYTTKWDELVRQVGRTRQSQSLVPTKVYHG